MTRVPAGRLLGIALVALLGPMVVRIPVAAATDVTFETPTASSVLGQSISFSVAFSSKTAPTRVELLRHVPDADGDFVEEAVLTPGDAGQYTATVVDQGHTLPNTITLYRFRVTNADGVATSEEQRFTVTDDRFEWRVREGTLIRVHWYQGDDAFADRALKVGEDGLKRAMDLLGVTETAPVDFFIYAEESAFREALGPGTRENVGGRAVPGIRTLFALIGPSEIGSDWIESVIPHELTHLVFGTASDNPYHFPPKWLNEGLAVYLEPGGYSADWRARVESTAKSGGVIPLDGLVFQFPAQREGFFLGYAESVSAVDFFVRRYGQETLVTLIRSYAQGVSDDDAFRAATGADVQAFNDAWIAEMNGTAAPAYGPQPAPPGPLPSDWAAAVSPGASTSPGESTAPSANPGVSAAPSNGPSGAPSQSPSAAPSTGPSTVPTPADSRAPASSVGLPSPGASPPVPTGQAITPTSGTDPGRRDGVLSLVLGLAGAGVLSLLGGVLLLRRSSSRAGSSGR